jgi:alpha-tubulin suppressor-like RCC1 family protein
MNRSGMTLKALFLMLVFFSPCQAFSSPLPKQGVWHGTIGDNSIMLCIEDGKAAYYYAGQSAEITLNMKDTVWIESVNGAATGYWTLDNQGNENALFPYIRGQWRKGRKGNSLSIELQYIADEKSACSSQSYKQVMLVPGEQKLSLPFPQSGQISSSHSSMAVLKPNGELWMWGENKTQPKLEGKNFTQIAVGYSHTIAIKNDGSLWGWGDNTSGQLGGDEIDGAQPVQMGKGFVAIAATDRYSLGIKSDGTLWSWGGVAPPGKFAEGPDHRKSKPTLLGKSFVSVSAGYASFAAIKDDGTLWMWGSNTDGVLGLGNSGSWSNRTYGYEILPSLVGSGFAQVSVGYAHAAAVKKDGTLWTWGHNTWAQLGIGKRDNGSNVPVKIGDGFSQVVAGFLNTAAIKKDGTLWLWGANESGIFGDCTKNVHDVPVQIGSNYTQITFGQHALLATRRDGSYWTFGWLWDGDQVDVARACRKPAQVVFGDGVNAWDKLVIGTLKLALPEPRMPEKILSIAAGGSNSAMVKADGTLWTWGNNKFGQLALGTVDQHNSPQHAGDGYSQVYIDGQHTLAIKQDGSLLRWGALPSSYPRGDFLKQKQTALASTKVYDGTKQLLRSGYQLERGLGLREDGTILDWGYYFQTSKQPTEFGQGVTEISAGEFGSFVIKKDGTLWSLAQYPVKPPPRHVGNNFIHIVQNTNHAYGIKADGSLWAWGDNSVSQLGDGTQTNRDDPVKIGTGYVQVAAGKNHGIALAADGSLWTWGNNNVGAIGDGTTTARLVPVKIGKGFAKIAAGDHHNLALKSDGTLWAWGSNVDGQLGDGTNVSCLVPVQIYPLLQGQSCKGLPIKPKSSGVNSP